MTEYFRMMANWPRLTHALFALPIASRCKPEDYKSKSYKINPASPFPPNYVGSHRGSTDPQSIKNSKSPSSIASVRPSARFQHNSATASALQVSTRKQQTANVRRTLRDSRRDPQNHASFDSKQYILLFVKCHSTHPTTKLMPPPAQPPSSQHQHPPSHTRLCPSNRSWSRRCRWGDVGTERRLRRSGSSIHKSLARCIPSH